jgi:hypothetical protein
MGAYPVRDEHAEARHGWASSFPVFRAARASEVVAQLSAFIGEPSVEQVRAWDESIPPLQGQVDEVLTRESRAVGYEAILEYELPLEFRRPDAILLAGGSVFVLEMKGKSRALQADIDQAAAYARDLRAYHRECETRPVHPILVLTKAHGHVGERSGVQIVGMDVIDDIVERMNGVATPNPVEPERFLARSAYRPLPSLVEAARELFQSRTLRRIYRAATATGPAVDAITSIIHEAAAAGERRLVLLTGLPGAGKTLVGLQIAHAAFLDDLAVDRGDGKPTAPAVFLSGNGPLVEVLQYELRSAGGGGRAFVRGVKQYVDTYSKSPASVPPEHVLIFDEAQRAFDAKKVSKVHGSNPNLRSEPEHFVEFARRVPGWCVVIALIGGGQEIHEGEEAGLGLWRMAVEEASHSDRWIVHGPPAAAQYFRGYPDTRLDDRLHLGSELRYHVATRQHEFVAGLIGETEAGDQPLIAHDLDMSGYHLRITRDLDVAKSYLRSRYADDPTARFGMIASSRDKDLERFGMPNGWNATKNVRYGPWYVASEDDPSRRSCRLLRDCVTEFGAQGLELDAVLLGWGTDYVLDGGRWSITGMRRYARGSLVEDPFRLRRNAYRVLLTRARDATIVYVPPLPALDETFAYLIACGFVSLDQSAI